MNPDKYIEIFLQPSEYYFGDQFTRIRTVLGSCVSITAWHPKRRVGFMCHYMLPRRFKPVDCDLDAKYAEDAVKIFLREAKSSNTLAKDYVIKIFGGGNMFPRVNAKNKQNLEEPSDMDEGISGRNIALGREILEHYGLKIAKEHVGGKGHRQVIFDVWSGDVWIRHIKIE